MNDVNDEPNNSNPLDAVGELANLHGWTAWFSLDHRERADEIMAHFAAAPAFVNALIAQAEPLHQSGNRYGVRAAMIEAHCCMTRLTDTFTWEEMPEEDRQSSGLRRGLDRLDEAAQRYAALLTDRDPTEEYALIALWRAALAPAGHNAAIRVTVATLEQAAQHLQQIRNVETTGPRPSNRLMRRCLAQVADAISRCQAISDIMDRTVPITLNEDIAIDEELTQEGTELGQHLREGDSDYAIMENTDRPEDSLLAYRNHSGIHVKRIIDNYEEDTPEEVAVTHAMSFLAIADEMFAEGRENALTFQKLARMVYGNSLAGFHDVDRLEFRLFMDQLRAINDDPIAVREAAMTALSEEYGGAELLLVLGGEEKPRVSTEQALAVIGAGRNSGMSEGQLRALAAAMEYQPYELSVQTPQASAEDIVDALDACPKTLVFHQMLKIVQAMGGDPSHEDIIAWAQDNCHDTFEHDAFEEDC